MKKTIAILLILVIGMVGVFAADAKLDFTADVSKQSLIKITTLTKEAYDFDDFVYEDFFDLDDTVDSGIIIDEDNFSAKVALGYLNYWSNQTGGLKTTVSATVLADRTDQTVNTSTIGYNVYLGEVFIVAVPNTLAKTASQIADSATTLIESSTTTSSSGSMLIEVLVDPNDYRLALASDDYTATITFNYEAN
jgi:hypothetical protein